MTEYSEVAEKRLPSTEGVDVGAEDDDAVNAHQRFLGRNRRRRRLLGREQGKADGFFEADRFHTNKNEDHVGARGYYGELLRIRGFSMG